MFIAIDTFILDKVFQKIANWANDHFGVTHYQIASAICGVALMMVLAEVALAPAEMKGLLFYTFAGVLTLYFLATIEWLARLDRAVDRQKVTLGMNPLRVTHHLLRVLLLIMVVVFAPPDILRSLQNLSLKSVIDITQHFQIPAVLYFAACSFRPAKPKRQEVPADLAQEGTPSQ